MTEKPADEAWLPYQQRVNDWMLACFGTEISADRQERNWRFGEEALELLQSHGCTKADAIKLVDYVYDRPQGDINQEVGGVMVTLGALCTAAGLDMAAEGERELARVWTMVEKTRAKHAAKVLRQPLPGPSIPAATPAPEAWVPWEGGECPVAPETMVVMRYPDRVESRQPYPAATFVWSHRGGLADIFFYRVVSPAITSAVAAKDEATRAENAQVEPATSKPYALMRGQAMTNASLRDEDPPPSQELDAATIEACIKIVVGFDGDRFRTKPGLFDGLTLAEAYALGIDDCAMWIANDLRALNPNGGAHG